MWTHIKKTRTFIQGTLYPLYKDRLTRELREISSLVSLDTKILIRNVHLLRRYFSAMKIS